MKRYRSNIEATRQFVVAKGLQPKQGMKAVETKWAFCFLSLRTKWAKMNRGKSCRHAASMKAFQVESVIGKVFNEFTTNFSVILRTVSSRRKVNTKSLEQLCKKTYLTLVSHWPNFKFTPAVHLGVTTFCCTYSSE